MNETNLNNQNQKEQSQQSQKEQSQKEQSQKEQSQKEQSQKEQSQKNRAKMKLEQSQFFLNNILGTVSFFQQKTQPNIRHKEQRLFPNT